MAEVYKARRRKRKVKGRTKVQQAVDAQRSGPRIVQAGEAYRCMRWMQKSDRVFRKGKGEDLAAKGYGHGILRCAMGYSLGTQGFSGRPYGIRCHSRSLISHHHSFFFRWIEQVRMICSL